MPYSKAQISNFALSQLGIDRNISNFDTERSKEANACRQWYDQTRQQVLSDFNWPCGTSFVALALVESDPTDEWGFSYRYPSNCLKIRRILSGLRTDTRDTRVPFVQAADTTGGLIYTDQSDAQVEFTFDQTDPTKLTPDFVMAFATRLAANIAPQLTAGDPFKIKQTVLQAYNMELGMAQANAANEQQPDIEPESEYIRARGGWGTIDGRPPWLP